MRLDIAKHALQGLLSDISWNACFQKGDAYEGESFADIYATEAVKYADALIRKLEETKP